MDHSERIVQSLFASAKAEALYAIVDAARSADAYELLRGCGAECQCLYDGRIPMELAVVAPYLVELAPTRPFAHELVARGWGKSWATFASTPLSLPALRKHLRRFLRVRTEQGKTLIFRYYDPRVLRVYLPTCNMHELSEFFGSISRFAMESEDARALTVFGRKASLLTIDRVELSTLAEATP